MPAVEMLMLRVYTLMSTSQGPLHMQRTRLAMRPACAILALELWLCKSVVLVTVGSESVNNHQHNCSSTPLLVQCIDCNLERIVFYCAALIVTKLSDRRESARAGYAA